jgi:hypothetical protein
MRACCLLLAIAIITTSCTVETLPPPQSSATATAEWTSPCAGVTKADLRPDCFVANPEQVHLVGTECPLHPGWLLLPDTVAIEYGYVSSERCSERPGLYVKSRLAVSGGCVMGRPFTEVAYCPECRRVRAEREGRTR